MRPTLAIVALMVLAGCAATPDARPLAGEADHPLRDSDFVWSPSVPIAGEPVVFDARIPEHEDAQTPPGLRWEIEGRSHSGARAIHTFTAPGQHMATLTILTPEHGPLTVQHAISVSAPPTTPQEGGTGSDPAPPPQPRPEPAAPAAAPTIRLEQDGHEVRLSFSWGLRADSVHWDLGDGTTSSADRPTHAYERPGRFDIHLRVTAGETIGQATTQVLVESVPFLPRVVVGVSDSGINPYHMTYYRPQATEHPCTYVKGYDDCSIPALPLTVGPQGGSYVQRLQKDAAVWDSVRTMTWYWIPQTNLIAVHCPEPYTGDATDTASYPDPTCILDDTKTHGTQTTSSVMSEAPDVLLVFNEGSGAHHLASSPVPIDIESNSWGTPPLYAGFTHAAGIGLCDDSIDSPFSIKLRSAGNNGPLPNMGDCMRNGHRSYSVAGGYPSGQHGYASGSTPDFASYWCRPAAHPQDVAATIPSICGTSFAAPTAAGAVAAALLEVRRALWYPGGSTADEVAPGISHEAFMDAVAQAATYRPTPRAGFPSSTLLGVPTQPAPWVYWGWGWLHAEQSPAIVACVLEQGCPDNKSPEAWQFNNVRRGFAADS